MSTAAASWKREAGLPRPSGNTRRALAVDPAAAVAQNNLAWAAGRLSPARA